MIKKKIKTEIIPYYILLRLSNYSLSLLSLICVDYMQKCLVNLMIGSIFHNILW